LVPCLQLTELSQPGFPVATGFGYADQVEMSRVPDGVVAPCRRGWGDGSRLLDNDESGLVDVGGA
jgi:hypothetical protein